MAFAKCGRIPWRFDGCSSSLRVEGEWRPCCEQSGFAILVRAKGGILNTDYLREFTLLAQYASFSKAARALHISQPALSNHIAALEKEAGAILVDRSRQDISLTPLGRAWLPEVNAALAQLDGLAPKLNRLRKYPEVKVVAEGYLEYSSVRDAMHLATQEVRRENPLFEVEVRGIDLFGMTDNVSSGKADLCLMMDTQSFSSDLRVETVCSDPLVAIVPKESPLGISGPIDFADLAGRQLLVPASIGGWSYFDWIWNLLDDRGIDAEVGVVYFASIGDLCNLDFQDKIYLDGASAASTLMESRRDRYRSVSFVDSSIAFNIVIVTRLSDDNPGVAPFVKALRSVFVKPQGEARRS